HANDPAHVQFSLPEHGKNLIQPDNKTAGIEHLDALGQYLVPIHHGAAVMIAIFLGIWRIGIHKVEGPRWEEGRKTLGIPHHIGASQPVEPDVIPWRNRP